MQYEGWSYEFKITIMFWDTCWPLQQLQGFLDLSWLSMYIVFVDQIFPACTVIIVRRTIGYNDMVVLAFFHLSSSELEPMVPAFSTCNVILWVDTHPLYPWFDRLVCFYGGYRRQHFRGHCLCKINIEAILGAHIEPHSRTFSEVSSEMFLTEFGKPT